MHSIEKGNEGTLDVFMLNAYPFLFFKFILTLFICLGNTFQKLSMVIFILYLFKFLKIVFFLFIFFNLKSIT